MITLCSRSKQQKQKNIIPKLYTNKEKRKDILKRKVFAKECFHWYFFWQRYAEKIAHSMYKKGTKICHILNVSSSASIIVINKGTVSLSVCLSVGNLFPYAITTYASWLPKSYFKHLTPGENNNSFSIPTRTRWRLGFTEVLVANIVLVFSFNFGPTINKI